MTSTEPTIAASMPASSPASGPTTNKTDLPPLSASDLKLYSRLATLMSHYHNHFRQTWTTLHAACITNQRPKGTSIRQFLALADSFVSQLTMHHDIEETYLFPHLALKMPQFQDQDAMKGQHRLIHKGLDVLAEYIKDCKRGERELRLNELKVIMDGFGDVLWRHLDEEVELLGPGNMRKYWTNDEMRNMPL